jgi:hypothetical protein
VGGRERKTYRDGRKCVWEGEREIHSKEIERVCESVRGRERKIERVVEKEVNLGERG